VRRLIAPIATATAPATSIAANQIGGDPSHPHNGQSRIVDPYGTVLAEVRGSKSGVVAADLDPARIRKARAWAPFLRDRRLRFS